MDTFRVRSRAKFRQQPGRTDTLPEPEGKIPCPCTHKGTRRETRPDPFGHYPTHPRALPPGLGKVPLITIAHVVDGKVQGGFTWAIGKGK